jgi:hypothetical protein
LNEKAPGIAALTLPGVEAKDFAVIVGTLNGRG